MKIYKVVLVIAILVLSATRSVGQVAFSPAIETNIEGITTNNRNIAIGRLESLISSRGMIASYGSRFVLACKIGLLERKISGNNLIQRLQLTFAVGDNISNNCFGSFTTECMGIGQTQGQALTNALRNINGNNPEIANLIEEAANRIVMYYDQNGPAIIRKAQSLIQSQDWEGAIFELSAIPQESKYFAQAMNEMDRAFQGSITQDAAKALTAAEALWAADPNPGETATRAMEILSEINPQSSVYPQARALMRRIEARNKTVADQERRDNVNTQNALINAYRAINVAYAKRQIHVHNHYHSWW